jgi:hypothetical protein
MRLNTSCKHNRSTSAQQLISFAEANMTRKQVLSNQQEIRNNGGSKAGALCNTWQSYQGQTGLWEVSRSHGKESHSKRICIPLVSSAISNYETRMNYNCAPTELLEDPPWGRILIWISGTLYQLPVALYLHQLLTCTCQLQAWACQHQAHAACATHVRSYTIPP